VHFGSIARSSACGFDAIEAAGADALPAIGLAADQHRRSQQGRLLRYPSGT
jgi:hypothetical protein